MRRHSVHIDYIFTSPGHNYLGHYGKAAGTHPVEAHDCIRCVAGKGIVGDRYFGHKEDFKGQITFFDLGVYDRMREQLHADVPPSAMRRNVLVRGLDLNQLIGRTFRIGDIEFQGTEECKPCFWMEEAVAVGAEDFLKGSGGLRAKILCDGELHVGDALIEEI